MCTQCMLYSSSVLNFCCVYFNNAHKKECTSDISDNPILQKRANKCRNTRTNTFFTLKSKLTVKTKLLCKIIKYRTNSPILNLEVQISKQMHFHLICSEN